MKQIRKTLAPLGLLVVAIAAIALTGCGSDDKESPAAPQLTISDQWVRATPPKQKASAAYMTITSPGGDKLVAAAVSPDVADHAELHLAEMNGSKMSMKEVPEITVPAGGSAELKPGGYHVMLIDLKEQIEAGDEIELTLTFEKAGIKKVVAVAKDE